MSFYLSRLLGINNVPTVALVNTSDHIWNNVWNNSLSKEWRRNTTVALIEWIDNLRRDRMPSLILDALINNKTIRSNDIRLKNMTSAELVELMQWSDLLIFDYITGNYDRVASMQDAALKENNTTILKVITITQTLYNTCSQKQKP
jgi:four-jointed box protein 1